MRGRPTGEREADEERDTDERERERERWVFFHGAERAKAAETEKCDGFRSHGGGMIWKTRLVNTSFFLTEGKTGVKDAR